MAWTSVGIRPGRRLASGGAQPLGDPAGETAGERWGATVRGLCERRPAGHEGCASGAGCGLRGKIEW
jgi:hypothetical protein